MRLARPLNPLKRNISQCESMLRIVFDTASATYTRQRPTSYACGRTRDKDCKKMKNITQENVSISCRMYVFKKIVDGLKFVRPQWYKRMKFGAYCGSQKCCFYSVDPTTDSILHLHNFFSNGDATVLERDRQLHMYPYSGSSKCVSVSFFSPIRRRKKEEIKYLKRNNAREPWGLTAGLYCFFTTQQADGGSVRAKIWIWKDLFFSGYTQYLCVGFRQFLCCFVCASLISPASMVRVIVCHIYLYPFSCGNSLGYIS